MKFSESSNVFDHFIRNTIINYSFRLIVVRHNKSQKDLAIEIAKSFWALYFLGQKTQGASCGATRSLGFDL